jgi:hypothetical protein
MKIILLVIILLFVISSANAEQVIRIYLSDGTTRDYKTSEIRKFGFTNMTEECLMKAYCQDNYKYSYHTCNIDSIQFNNFFEKDRMMTVIEVGYAWYLNLSKIDSIKFDHLQKAPSVEWQNSFGGSKEDYLISLQKTDDGGYLIFGQTSSNDGDVIGNSETSNLWIAKINSRGELEWQKPQNKKIDLSNTTVQKTFDNGYIIGGHHYNKSYKNEHFISKYSDTGYLLWEIVYGENGNSGLQVIPTSDAGAIVAGSSPKNPAPGNHPDDIWIIKLNENGGIEWERSYGGSYSEYLTSFISTSDKGYILLGVTCSTDGDLKGIKKNGTWDYWVVKLDSECNIVWQKVLGGSEEDTPTSIRETEDHGYIVIGNSWSKNGDVTKSHGNSDIWAVKLDNTGNIVWTNSLGGSGNDVAKIIEITKDKGCIIAGYSNSVDGDIVGSIGINSYWIVKLDSSGLMQWQKPITGFGEDDALHQLLFVEDGYVILGSTQSNGGDITGHINNSVSYDYWVTKLSMNGEIIWQKSYGGSKSDYANGMFQTEDGGFVLSGRSGSNDGAVSNNHGLRDIWILKLNGQTEPAKTDSLMIEMKNGDITCFSITQIEKIDIQNITNTDEVINSNDVFSISPNPSTDFIEISVGTGRAVSEQSDIKIFNIYGQTVLSVGAIHELPLRVDISGLAPGMYFVRIGDRVQKLVKI